MPDAPTPPTTVPPTEPGETSVPTSRSFAAIALALALVGIATAGLSWVFHALDRIDNSPVDYAEFGGNFSILGFVACLLAGVASAVGWNQTHLALRRASRFTGVTVIVCLFLCRSPIPIVYLLALSLLIGGGLFVVAAFDPLFALVRTPGPQLKSRYILLAVLAGFAAASAALLLLKLSGMGWNVD